MSSSLQVLMWTWCFTSLGLAEDVSEGVPILKQINRVNDDGSYTFGYEAADGSFKIETRDVQGNVKGMFGYIDEGGDLKRVSYTASNGTGFQSLATTSKPADYNGSEGNAPTSTTRRPVFILRQPTSTRTPVIQHIPRKSTTTDGLQSTTTPAYGEYINGRKPVMEIILNSASSNVDDNHEEVQEIKPTPTPATLRRILVTRKPLELVTPRQGKGGNALRRQLNNDPTSRPVDSHDVYPEDGNSRPITPPTRFQNPILSSLLPQATPAFRNHILAQNSGRVPPFLLRPEFPGNSEQTFQQQFDPQRLPDLTTTTPVPHSSFPTQHRLYSEAPLPQIPIARKFRPPLPLDEQQYPITNGQDFQRRFRPTHNGPQISPVLQSKPVYPPDAVYNQGPQLSAVQSLRDELMEYLLQYLQQRTGRANQGFNHRFSNQPVYNPQYTQYNPNQYPNQNPYFPNPTVPYNPYPNQYFPYPNQTPFYNPYMVPNYPFQNPNSIYQMPLPISQPFAPTIGVGPPNPYVNLPYNNPNVQHSSQQQQISQPTFQTNYPVQNLNNQLTEARIGLPLQRNFRPTNPTNFVNNEISQREILKVLAASPTRATPPQSYSTTTETSIRSTQPVRNVQILGSASETVTHRVTTIKDEMEQTSR